MFLTDDPIRDFYNRDEEEYDWLQSRPICSECGEHIQTDELYEVNDELICPQCMEDNHRKWTEDYIE